MQKFARCHTGNVLHSLVESGDTSKAAAERGVGNACVSASDQFNRVIHAATLHIGGKIHAVVELKQM